MRVSEAMSREVAPVGEVMSSEQVLYCYEDEDLDHVAKNMGEERGRCRQGGERRVAARWPA